jgi:hypothetical protein
MMEWIKPDRINERSTLMTNSRDQWAGFNITVNAERNKPGTYRVVFDPRGLQAVRGPGGSPSRMPRSAVVVVLVNSESEGAVQEYAEPERAIPGLNRADYEAKALDMVKGQTVEV